MENREMCTRDRPLGLQNTRISTNYMYVQKPLPGHGIEEGFGPQVSWTHPPTRALTQIIIPMLQVGLHKLPKTWAFFMPDL